MSFLLFFYFKKIKGLDLWVFDNMSRLGSSQAKIQAGSIHETEIKQFGNRNGRNRVKIILTLGHKSRIVETDYEGRNELQESKQMIKVEMDYVVRALTD